MAQKKNYINGVFVRKNESTYGEIINIGLTDDAIAAISKLQKNDKGVRNISMAPQKEDSSKYSVWENDYKPKTADTATGLPF